MFSAFALALGQLTDPRIRRVILRSLLATFAAYFATCAVLWGLVFGTSLLDHLGTWGRWTVDIGAILVPLGSLLLLGTVMTSMVGLFLDDVAEAVEVAHYPGLPPVRRRTIGETIAVSLRLSGLMILLNLLLLPLYFFPVVGQVAYYAVNGYLIGREYFEAVALRRSAFGEVRGRFRGDLGVVWVMGAVVAFLFTIPFLNILAPIIGVAAMVHRARQLETRRPGAL